MKYDPKIIHEMADRMYEDADSAETVFPIVFGVTGAGIGFTIGFALGNFWIPTLVGAAILGGIGYWTGQARAFSIRLAAQLMLVNLKIEENTRPVEPSSWVPQPTKGTRAAANRISEALGR